MGWDTDVAPALTRSVAVVPSRGPGGPRHSVASGAGWARRLTWALSRGAISLVLIAAPIAAVAPFTTPDPGPTPALSAAGPESLRAGFDRLSRGERGAPPDLGPEVRAAALSTAVVFGALGLTVATGLLGGWFRFRSGRRGALPPPADIQTAPSRLLSRIR